MGFEAPLGETVLRGSAMYPVLDERRLAGIVSRSNLVQALAAQGRPAVDAHAPAWPASAPARSWPRRTLCIIQRHGARNCSLLIHALLDEGLEPGTTVAGFLGLGLGVRGWSARLRLLIGTHQWSVQRIAANVNRIVSEAGRRTLKAMLDAHRADMASCREELRLLGCVRFPRSGP